MAYEEEEIKISWWGGEGGVVVVGSRDKIK